MKHLRRLLSFLPLLPAAALVPPAPPRPPVEASIEDLAFLEGAWFGTDGESDWETVYTSPLGGEVVSASKELRADRVVTHDFERFFERGGTLVLTPFPFGRKSVDFPLVELDPEERRAVFENPDHDFPRRFTYHRHADGRLRILLEGDGSSGSLRVEIELERR